MKPPLKNLCLTSGGFAFYIQVLERQFNLLDLDRLLPADQRGPPCQAEGRCARLDHNGLEMERRLFDLTHHLHSRFDPTGRQFKPKGTFRRRVDHLDRLSPFQVAFADQIGMGHVEEAGIEIGREKRGAPLLPRLIVRSREGLPRLPGGGDCAEADRRRLIVRFADETRRLFQIRKRHPFDLFLLPLSDKSAADRIARLEERRPLSLVNASERPLIHQRHFSKGTGGVIRSPIRPPSQRRSPKTRIVFRRSATAAVTSIWETARRSGAHASPTKITSVAGLVRCASEGYFTLDCPGSPQYSSASATGRCSAATVSSLPISKVAFRVI